jgi:hypothetical protein
VPHPTSLDSPDITAAGHDAFGPAMRLDDGAQQSRAAGLVLNFSRDHILGAPIALSQQSERWCCWNIIALPLLNAMLVSDSDLPPSPYSVFPLPEDQSYINHMARDLETGETRLVTGIHVNHVSTRSCSVFFSRTNMLRVRSIILPT